MDIISKLSSLQQYANIQQSSTQPQDVPENTSKSNYIYISKEDLVQMFPSLEGKLDLSKIISTLLGSISVVKEPLSNNEARNNENQGR
jgi:hypothetical protein